MHKICFTVSFISCLYMFRAHLLWNKFCASSWLNTEINILRCTVSKTSKKKTIFSVLLDSQYSIRFGLSVFLNYSCTPIPTTTPDDRVYALFFFASLKHLLRRVFLLNYSVSGRIIQGHRKRWTGFETAIT